MKKRNDNISHGKCQWSRKGFFIRGDKTRANFSNSFFSKNKARETCRETEVLKIEREEHVYFSPDQFEIKQVASRIHLVKNKQSLAVSA